MAIAVIAPLGLIAPGFAYGEGSPRTSDRLRLRAQGSAGPVGFLQRAAEDYDLPLPFFSGADAPLWHTAIGYEIAG